MNLPNHVTLQKSSVYTSLREGGGLGRSPKTEGAIGRKAHLTAGDGASLRLSYFLPRFHEAARKIGVGYRQPPASTIPSANRNCTARLLPQSPAVTAPSRRELWGLYLATLACCLWESACCESLRQKSEIFASSLWQGSLWVRHRYWVKFREKVKIDKYQRHLSIFGGDYRTRTCDLMRVKHAL